MSGLRHTPIHRALYRPHLFLGGERELVLITGVFSFGLAVTSLTWVAVGIGAFIWVVSVAALRWMAKSDPPMSRVYRRSLSYASYYPPRSRPWRKDVRVPVNAPASSVSVRRSRTF